MLPSPSHSSQLFPGQHSQHTAKMPLCPADPMVLCWFLTPLNESPWWPQNLSHHRSLTGYRWLTGLYTSLGKCTHEEQMGRSGSQSQSHSLAGAVRLSPREPQGQKKYNALEVAKPALRAISWASVLGATPTPAHLAITAHKNGLDLIPQPLLSCLHSLLFLVCRNNNIGLFFLMAKFPASLMGIMSMRKYLSDAGIAAYVVVAVLIHCKLLYLVQLFGVWCYCRHTEDLYPDLRRSRTLAGLFNRICEY